MKNIDKLINICKLSQKELKHWLFNHLSNYYDFIDSSDGYIYCKGDIPVCLVAHMDTVHSKPVSTVWVSYDNPDIITSPQGIGGDDRCGVFALLQLKYLKPHLLFTEDEEIGAIGAEKFTKAYPTIDVNAFIEIDRRGSNDVVVYDDDNDSLKKVFEKYGFKEEYGSFSDISVLCPHFGISGVNISSGYYNAHTTNEYINLGELLLNIKRIKKVITKEDFNSKYEYKESNYGWGGNYYDYYGKYYDYYGYYRNSKRYDNKQKSTNPKSHTPCRCSWCQELESDRNFVYNSDYFDNICEDCVEKFGLEVCDDCGEVFDPQYSQFSNICECCAKGYIEYDSRKKNA